MAGGRPKKDPKERRDQRFNLRLTAGERDELDTQAYLAGINPHEFARRRVLGYVVPHAENHRAIAGVVTELNRLGLELSAIGNNANQLARAANSGRRAHVEWDAVVARIHELGDQVTAALEKVVEP